MVDLALALRRLLLVCFALALVGCAHRFPASESELAFSYPLQECTPAKLEEAGRQAANLDAPLRRDDSTVCRTGLVNRQTAATTPVNAADEHTGAACAGLKDDEPPDETDAERKKRLEEQAFSRPERCLRQHLEAPFTTTTRKPAQFGIALSGGGSKAAAFAVGVMAGLSDFNMLDRADYLSSVSGGGYAAYFYYAHRIFPIVRPGPLRPVNVTTAELFRDCVAKPDADDAMDDIIRRIGAAAPYCDRQSLRAYTPPSGALVQNAGYQALLKCTQDMMRPGECSMAATSSWRRGISLPTWGGSLATIIPSFFSNTLFDWGMATSPSAISYQDGIGLSYGATLSDTANLSPAIVTQRTERCGHLPGATEQVLDCHTSIFDPDPDPMRFDELRVGLLKLRAAGGDGIPFWILNAAAPQHRSLYGWLRQGRDDITNSDMFEMTAVSQGSGRYGYVSASPAIHGMSVLHGVRTSAAFLDANQLVLRNAAVRTIAGGALHLANLDWGLDIANYNVSTQARRIHRALPFPFYYLDRALARVFDSEPMPAERRDRERSVFIRLIDGGNAENLGAYSLLKRGVKNILIADAAGDSDGQFSDLCGLRRRLKWAPDGLFPRFVHLPGLHDFDGHCEKLDARDKGPGYNLHAWFKDHPLLLGCIRQRPAAKGDPRACHGLGDNDIRLLIAKPALDMPTFQARQLGLKDVSRDGRTTRRSVLSDCWIRGTDKATDLLNCDTATFLHFNRDYKRGDCLLFPQHSTVLMTINSSATLFVAYRELARQHVWRSRDVLEGLLNKDGVNVAPFEQALEAQATYARRATGAACEPF